MKICIKCGLTDRFPSGKCRPCTKSYYSTHEGKRIRIKNDKKYRSTTMGRLLRNKSCLKWAKEHPDRSRAKSAKRHATKLNAIPAWANHFFIEEIYDLAQRRTKLLGFAWEVDHIVPLQNKLVCGLHCEENLQVISMAENRKKHNNHWPNMPGENNV